MRRKSDIVVPEWSRKIEDMRQTRKLSQEGFGSRVGVSAMAVSRWERGVAEPTGETYIRLGNLAEAPLCWFFWKRAGLRLSDVTRVLPEANRRFAENRIFDVQVVNAGSQKKHSLAKVDLVAIPLLPVHAVALPAHRAIPRISPTFHLNPCWRPREIGVPTRFPPFAFA